MSFYFFINNLSFAFGMIGAIVLFIAAWLSFDAYKLQKNQSILFRFIGFILFAIWKVVDSLHTGNDLVLYFAFFVFLGGLFFIVASFVKTTQLAAHAIIVIPAFSVWSHSLYVVSTLLFITIFYFSFQQYKKEFNHTWIPFSIAFLFFALSAFFNIFVQSANQTSFLYVISRIIELLGFVFLGYWVWQFMRLRISESFVMISVGVTFILATIVTLAFSTILIGRVSSETAANLLTDVKVLNFSIDSLKEESLAKALLVSKDQELLSAISKNNFVLLEQLAEKFLERYHLGFLSIADAEGLIVVRAHAVSRRGDSIAGERLFEEVLLKNSMVTIEDSAVEGFSIRAGAPILEKNKVVGMVIAGFPLDNTFTDRLKKLTGLEMLIYNNDISVASTLFDTDGRTRLLGEMLSDTKIKNTIFTDDQIFTGSTNFFGSPFHASFMPLTNSDEKVIGAISAAKSQQDIVNIANATNRLTLITVMLIMLILLLPIYFASKQFSRNS